MDTATSDPAVSRMLLQLNLHKALEHCFKGHQIFSDLRRKQEGDAIFGKAYIAESAIRLHEALFGSCFHLNAITDGGRTRVFDCLDRLKNRINRLIDSPDDSNKDEDAVSRLLAKVIEETRSSSPPEPNSDCPGLADQPTAGDVLAYLSVQTLAAVEQQSGAHEGKVIEDDYPVTTVPVDYFGSPDEPFKARTNECVKLVADGVKEVAALTGFDAGSHRAGRRELHETILYSTNTFSLLVNSPLFKGAVGAGVFDDAAGNYIYLLIIPGDEMRDHAAVRQLLLRSLYWLDFDTTEGRQVICAGIRHLTREEMRDHLSMLGKLLPYAAIVGSGLESEESVRGSVDYFLETVV